VPGDKYIEKLEYLLSKNAAKRESWSRARRRNLYMIAFDFEDMNVTDVEVDTCLLGRRESYGPGLTLPNIRLPSKVNDAVSSGWGPFLLAKCVVPNVSLKTLLNFTVASNRGFFYRRRVAKNVSAVISMFAGRCAITPNPYAEPTINGPTLVNYM